MLQITNNFLILSQNMMNLKKPKRGINSSTKFTNTSHRVR